MLSRKLRTFEQLENKELLAADISAVVQPNGTITIKSVEPTDVLAVTVEAPIGSIEVAADLSPFQRDLKVTFPRDEPTHEAVSVSMLGREQAIVVDGELNTPIVYSGAIDDLVVKWGDPTARVYTATVSDTPIVEPEFSVTTSLLLGTPGQVITQDTEFADYEFSGENTGTETIEFNAEFTVEIDGETHVTEARDYVVDPAATIVDEFGLPFDGLLDYGSIVTQKAKVWLGDEVVFEDEVEARVIPTTFGPTDLGLDYRLVDVGVDTIVFDVTIANHHPEFAAIDWGVFDNSATNLPGRGDHGSLHFPVIEPGERRTVRLESSREQVVNGDVVLSLRKIGGSFALGDGKIQEDLNADNDTVTVSLEVPMVSGLLQDNGQIVISANEPTSIVGINIDGPLDSLTVGEDLSPFQQVLDAQLPKENPTRDNVSFSTLGIGSAIQLDGKLTLPVVYDGPLSDLTVQWGDADNKAHSVPITLGLPAIEGLLKPTGEITINGFGQEVVGVQLRAPEGTLVASADLAPFTGALSFGDELVLTSVGQNVVLDGEITLPVVYAGNSVDELTVTWGDADSTVRPIEITVEAEADLLLEVTTPLRGISPFEPLGVYQGSITNNGPTVAEDVELLLEMAVNGEVVASKTVELGSIRPSQVVTLDESLTQEAFASLDLADVVLQRATVSSTTHDPDNDNNNVESQIKVETPRMTAVIGNDGTIRLVGGDYPVRGIELITSQGVFRVQDDSRFAVIEDGNRVAVASLNGAIPTADDGRGLLLPIRYHGPAENISGVWGIVGGGNSYPITMVTGNGCGLGTLPGDADGDGEVAFLDFLMLANNFGATDATYADGDFNCDGSVTFLDFLILANNFGKAV